MPTPIDISRIEPTYLSIISKFHSIRDAAEGALDVFFKKEGVAREAFSIEISAIQGLASHIDAVGTRLSEEGKEPLYHNRQHVLEVVGALIYLLSQESIHFNAQHWPRLTWPLFSIKERLLMLTAVIGHDYLHNGSVNQAAFELELISANAVRDFLIENGLSQFDAQEVHQMILMTDFTQAKLIHENVRQLTTPKALTFITRANILINEADLLPSLLPRHGGALGDLLAGEWRAAGISIDPSEELARKDFLQSVKITSPHSKIIGLARLIQIQIH